MISRVKAFFAVQDMTEGGISKNIVRFSVPLLLGNIAQQAYQMVDSIIVGQSVEGGLAAIGTTTPIINFMMIIYMAISTGAGVMVSQLFGAREHKKLSKTIANVLFIVLLTSILLMLIVIPTAENILLLISTPEDVIGMATDYLRITFIGILGMAMYNIIVGILRGLGDSFTPLLFLLIATILNTILDIIFVWQWGWGVAGAAWATIISQAVSAIFSFLRLYRLETIPRLSPRDFLIDQTIFKELFRLGIPAGIMQGIFSIAMILVQNLINRMGTTVIEANTAVIRIDALAMMPNFTFGMAATTFVGQNIGAAKMDRVRRGTKVLARMALGVSIFLTVFIIFFGRNLLGWFTSNPDVITIGGNNILILSLGYIAVSQSQVYGGVLRGAGDTMPAMWISLLTSIVLRTPLAYLLAYMSRSETWPNGSPYWVQLSLLVAWIVGAFATYAWFKFGSWREKAYTRLKLKEEAEEEWVEETFGDV